MRNWLTENIPNAHVLAALSTASAAQRLGTEDPPPYDAAISPAVAAEHYGLEVLVDGIGDNVDASTRFVQVRRPGPPPTPSGADKTTLVLFMREDHSGALLEILTEFAVRGVNLTRIESRPTRKQLGDYYFSVDCEGHVDDARVGEALAVVGALVRADYRQRHRGWRCGAVLDRDGSFGHQRGAALDCQVVDPTPGTRDLVANAW